MPFPVPADVRAKTDALQREFVDAWKAHDLTRLSATYTKNGKAMPAGAPIQTGTAAISAFFGSVIKMGVDHVELTTDDLHASDSSPHPDSIYECARYTFFAADGSTIDKGKYLAILTQEDGAWKYAYDMFSSNGPLTSA